MLSFIFFNSLYCMKLQGIIIIIIIIIISLFRKYIKAKGPWYIHVIHFFMLVF